MKLSLSVRIAESYSDKKKSVLSLEKICENAKLSNYQGICMRPSQIGIENSKEEILKAYQIVTSNNLTVSMVTGDFDIPANNELSGIAQRNITPYIDLCKLLNSKLIRIAIKNLEDVKYTQYACDEAKERGVNLVHQMHTGTMFETVDEALKIVSKIKRANFGIVYNMPKLWGRVTFYRVRVGNRCMALFEALDMPFLLSIWFVGLASNAWELEAKF